MKRVAKTASCIVTFVLCASISACAGASAAEGEGEGEGEGEPEVAFYVGTVTVTDPNTGASFGPPQDTVVKRTDDTFAGTIVEEVLDGTDTIITTMTRRGNTNVFDASDDGATFTGTLTYTGTPGAFSGWTYAIVLTDGSGAIEGSATIDALGIATDKTFRDPDGLARARIQDALSAVDEATYAAEHDRLAP